MSCGNSFAPGGRTWTISNTWLVSRASAFRSLGYNWLCSFALGVSYFNPNGIRLAFCKIELDVVVFSGARSKVLRTWK